MSATQLVFAMLCLSTTYALKVLSDYDYSDYKGTEGETKGHGHSRHWTAHDSDHSGSGHGENQHHHNFFDHSGASGEGNNKAGAHVKHQVTKGFQNYHHKDEVGRTTSYIDSFGDSGDHYGNYEAGKAWGGHGDDGFHKNHHSSDHSGHEGISHLSFNQNKEDFKKKKEGASIQKKDDYKGDIAEIIYAKKPAFQPKTFQHPAFLQHVPYPYYFY